MSIRRDSQWVRQSFFIPDVQTQDAPRSKAEYRDRRGHSFSSAELKFTDTTLGGNFGMNPRPQFTRWADPKEPGLAYQSKGMGEFYSEAIDDNARLVHFQFGIPEYNAMTNFFSTFYDRSHGALVNTGEAKTITFMAGYAAGWILTAPLQIIIGFQSMVGRAIDRVMAVINNRPYSKFYYLKPTMPQYWSAVSTMVNKLGVYMGVIAAPSGEALESDIAANKPNPKYAEEITNKSMIANLQRHLPDIYRGDSVVGVDIFAISLRAQRLANQHHKKMKEIGKNSGGSYAAYKQALSEYLTRGKLSLPPSAYYNIPHQLDTYYKTGPIGRGVGADKMTTLESDADVVGLEPNTDKYAANQYANQRMELANVYSDDDEGYLAAALNDGGAFVSFFVDYDKEVSESFSNSAKTSDIESKMNAMSAGGRSMHFNLMGGNVGDGPIADSIEGFVSGVKNLIGGMAASVGISGLAALGGAAYVDIPDFWENASADMPRADYTIRLSSPYGNKFAIYNNIYIPLCMLLAGALPRSTGKNSYSSPFLCSLHDTGRNIVRLGIIESISITRGTSNIGWSVDGLPTAVDVNISIKNLEKIMHMPVTELAGPDDMLTLSMFDEDTALTDYLAAISGLGLYDRYYFLNRLDMMWRLQMADFNSWTSPAHHSSNFAGTGTGRFLSAFYRGTERIAQ